LSVCFAASSRSHVGKVSAQAILALAFAAFASMPARNF
jgi:hypothetical protein